MFDNRKSSNSPQKTGIDCLIKIKGYLDEEWSNSLGDLEISYDKEGNTILAGQIADQAALHGILGQIRDAGMTILSLTSQVIVELGDEAES